MVQPLNQCPVRKQALLNPEQLAIQAEQQSLTYRQLDQLIGSLTKQFSAKGITEGDRLICIAENSLELILLQLSCLRSAVIFCPINPRFSLDEINTRLTVLNSHFIWCHPFRNDLPHSKLTFDFTVTSQNTIATSNIEIDPQQVINIIFTSGSSGQPKAVMHSFSNHFYSALGSQSLIPLSQGDNNFLSLPIFHISGYATVLRTVLAGASILLDKNRFSVSLLKQLQITHLSLVATQLYRLLEDPDFHQNNLDIKHLLLGGSTFSDQLLDETAKRGLTYHLSYGLTEMSSQVSTSCNSTSLSILPEREVKIVDGEIFLRGKTRFVGYFNGQLENSIIPPEQWFSSKDLGTKTDNQLQIQGRKDRQFISGGENIQPEEIEACLIRIPEVKRAFVVAVNDPVYGDRPVAFIDYQQQHIDHESLNRYVHQKLSTYKCPIHYFQLPEQTGIKVSLTDLKKHADAYYTYIKAKLC